ncbi:CP4-57 prophage protein [Escherichia coli]|nr:CP4-57 prophage protein [Escherichia coli]
MKIRSLSRFVLASTMFASFTASAVPGLWQQGYGQGNAEYSVTDASGKMFTINCTEIRTRTVFTSTRFF